MRKVDILFSAYGVSHQNHQNQLIHYICVPLIFWSILGLISLISTPCFYVPYLGNISVASIVAILFVNIYYFTLHWKMATVMLFVLLFFEKIIEMIHQYFQNQSWMIFLFVFILSWIFQFIGHEIEGKKPSFLMDIQFLLIGPLWVLKKLLSFGK